MRAAIAIGIASAALGVVGGAQPLAPPAQGASPASGLIRIDAVVTDARGRPVPDLKADDFAIVEDEVAEPVASATFVAAGATGDAAVVPVRSRAEEQAEAGRPGARLFAIFLDEYHVAAGDESEQARALVTRFVESEMGPRDLAVIVKPLDSLLNLRMTHDRATLLGVVRTFEGRKGEYEPKNAFEQNYFAAAPARIEDVRSQIVTSALNALSTHLGGLQPGRKTLLLVSDGFGRPPRSREEPLPTIESVTRNANRGGVSIYAVDPRALAGASPASAADGAGNADAEHAALRALAKETDGRAVLAAGDVASGVSRLVNDASAYYLLSFHPAHASETRTFHTIDVRVKRPNLTVHARQGYWPASADELAMERAEKRLATPPPPPQPMRHSSPLIRPWFGVARASEAAGGAMQVSFVWEPVPPVPGDRVRRGPPTLVAVKASRETDGQVVFEGAVRPTSADGDSTPQQVTFDTQPGRLLLQLAVQDADQNVLDTDVRDVIVGALAGPVEVGTPEVLRAESARDFRAIDGNPDAVPVATREFRRSDRLLIRLPVYAAGGSPTVTATLSSKPGGVMRQLPVTRAGVSGDYQTDLSLSSLAAGDYAIAIGASSASGTAGETIAFRIVP